MLLLKNVNENRVKINNENLLYTPSLENKKIIYTCFG